MNTQAMVPVISLFVAICALLFTALSFRRTVYKDNGENATQRATMTADIKYIRQSIDEIKLENRAIRNDVSELKTKVAEVEASTKSAHKRLDDLIKEHGND